MVRRFASLVAVLALAASNGTATAQRTVFRTVDPSPVAISDESTPPIDVGRLADLIDSMVNAERERHGLLPLGREPGLDRIGTRHSEDMGMKGYFDHVDLEGRNATQRAHAGGYVCVASMENPTSVSIGENLFSGFRYSEYSLTYHPGKIVANFTWKTEEQFAREAVDAWMASPPHRENLLHPAYHLQGIGVYVSDSLEVFVTQNLC